MENFFYFVENLVKSSPLLSLPLVFISGVFLSLTPCFYPLIPVILGVIGIEKDTTFKKAFSLSLIYVLGLASVYTSLGVLSSLTGSIFGDISKFVWVRFVGATLFLFMGLILLDIFPSFSINFSLKFNYKKLGIFGVFLLGGVSGLISGSCTFPVFGAILFLMVFNKDIFLGGFLLFIFSLGIGTIFIIVALFGKGLLDFFRNNPKVSLGIKKILGILLIGGALYFLVKGFYLL